MVVIVEESAEVLATANPTHALRRRRTVDEFVPEPLVIALALVVLGGIVKLRAWPTE